MATRAVDPFQGNTALTARKKDEELTPFHKLFILEYLIDLNATAAYIRAGGDPFRAEALASKLLRNGHIVARHVKIALAERAARVGISADRVIREWGRMAFGDVRNVLREDGSLKNPHEYTEDDAAMIKGVKTRRIVELDADGKMQQAEITEITFIDRLSATNAVAKHLGMLNDKLDITVTSVATRMEEAMRRTGRRPPRRDDDEKPFIDVTDDDAPAPEEQKAKVDHELARMLGLPLDEGEDDDVPDLDTMLGRGT